MKSHVRSCEEACEEGDVRRIVEYVRRHVDS